MKTLFITLLGSTFSALVSVTASSLVVDNKNSDVSVRSQRSIPHTRQSEEPLIKHLESKLASSLYNSNSAFDFFNMKAREKIAGQKLLNKAISTLNAPAVLNKIVNLCKNSQRTNVQDIMGIKNDFTIVYDIGAGCTRNTILADENGIVVRLKFHKYTQNDVREIDLCLYNQAATTNTIEHRKKIITQERFATVNYEQLKYAGLLGVSGQHGIFNQNNEICKLAPIFNSQKGEWSIRVLPSTPLDINKLENITDLRSASTDGQTYLARHYNSFVMQLAHITLDANNFALRKTMHLVMKEPISQKSFETRGIDTMSQTPKRKFEQGGNSENKRPPTIYDSSTYSRGSEGIGNRGSVKRIVNEQSKINTLTSTNERQRVPQKSFDTRGIDTMSQTPKRKFEQGGNSENKRPRTIYDSSTYSRGSEGIENRGSVKRIVNVLPKVEEFNILSFFDELPGYNQVCSRN